ncbi:unnamed protein product [Mytilus edulis]|uniref:Kringle domain-containing protein n=1 Tax=Mytilus edulis TaxID=6550 RepID=A0A8S3UMA7_MYTED|nr:unnamed protein product [Mytilus edulis]
MEITQHLSGEKSMVLVKNLNIKDVTCYFEFDKGEAYNGTVNITVNGKACINWKTYNSNYTHYYEDHNYCRNPRTDAFDQPWCYYADGYKTAVCSITACDNKIVKRPDWRKCDKQIYQEAITTKLKEIDLTEIQTTSEAIENLENILHHAGNLSIPKYRKQSVVTTKGKSIWNQDINNASRKSKEAFYIWKQDMQNHELKNEMQTAKRRLRSAQRRAHASQRIALTEKIMKSSQSDKKLFHK